MLRSICWTALCIAVATSAGADDRDLPTFHDTVRVVDTAPLLLPVKVGQSVRVRFPVGGSVTSTSMPVGGTSR